MRDLTSGGTTLLTLARPKAVSASCRRRSALVAAALGATAVVGLAAGIRYGVPIEAAGYRVTASVFEVTVNGPGMLDAQRRASLGATVQGRISALPVAVGDLVTAGTPVARLDAAEAEIELAQAIEQTRALTHQIAEAVAQLRREEASYRRFERDLARKNELRARAVVAEAAVDIARTERDRAAAEVAVATARIERLKADLGGAERLVDRRREALTNHVVAAPFDGVVIARSKEIGDVVTAGSTIIEIVDPTTLVLSARIDESQIASIGAGQMARVDFGSEPGRTHAARVHRIGREVDPQTRELIVDLVLGSLPANWAIGQRGVAAITVARQTDTLALPPAMVSYRDGTAGAWVLEDGRARWRPLRLGTANGDRVAVVAGLDEGDTALVGPRLYAGMRVRSQP